MYKKFFIKTFGCQVNYKDSENIEEIFKKNNINKVHNFDYSDIIVINLCTIRNSSFKKVSNYIKKIILISKKNFCIILTGCIPIIYISTLLKNVNIIINSSNIMYIIRLINFYFLYNCKQVSINFYKELFNNINYKINNIKNYFYITIIEGCNKYCSYCIVPYTKGIEISKYLNLILREIFSLNKRIINEIYLLGQNVNSYYGKLFYNSKKFIKFYILLNYINQINFLKLINFVTSHPKDFDNNLINLYKFIKLKKYLHLPVQSCSDKILLKMKRNYKIINYKYIINSLRFNNFMSISTDIIVGFPTESYIDFNKTLIFIEKFLFDKSYIFLYNPRPYTLSLKYIDDNSISLKKKRFYSIQKKIINNIYYINKLMLYKIEIVLVKNNNFKNKYTYIAFTNNNRLVSFEFYERFNIINKFVKVKIIFFKKKIFFSSFYDL